MKRLDTSLGIHLPPVSLHREDVEHLANMLTQNDGALSIRTELYEYGALSEMFENHEDPLLKLSLSREQPRVSVQFDGSIGVWIYASSDDLFSKAIFFELKSFLESKRRRSHLLIAKTTKFAGLLGALGMGVFASVKDWTAVLLCFMLIPLDLIFSFAKHRCFIGREPSAQRKSFWQRNSDQILTALIGAIAGAIITLLITLLLPNAKP